MQQEGSAVKRIAPNLADCAAEQGSPSKENMPPGLLNTAGTSVHAAGDAKTVGDGNHVIRPKARSQGSLRRRPLSDR